MPSLRQPGKRLPHTTLTENAAKIAKALKKNGFTPYPGVIDPHGGKGARVRVTVVVEPNRVRLIISGGGAQEILLYGGVNRAALLAALENALGRNSTLTVRDALGLWETRT